MSTSKRKKKTDPLEKIRQTPEYKAEARRLKREVKYLHEHPEECKHDATTGPVGAKQHRCLMCGRLVPNADWREEAAALRAIAKKEKARR